MSQGVPGTARVSPPESAPESVEGVRILLIDDDEALAQLLVGYLGPLGFSVDWEGDGRRGLERALNGKYAAVVLDVRVPGLNGIEVLRRIRETSRVPVIMMSALGDEPDRIAGLEMGADDYLPKSASSRELLARLQAVLRRANPGAGSTGESPAEALLKAEKGKGKRKAKEKARAAWISFVGRIVAQVVGAIATVWLGIAVADRVRSPAPMPAAVAPPSRVTETSIAVLPFDNLTGLPRYRALSDGLTDAIGAELGQIRSMKVIPRASVMQDQISPKPVTAIAGELGATYVLEGSIYLAADKLQVRAQLIHAPSESREWTQTYDRSSNDLVALQAELSARIVGDVNAFMAQKRSGGK